ncbi:hypothetical protein GLOTRDRAFT_96873 [Gloeophyllum trabeum ATCC 11539]|uniref:Uncharacterized protein n=1 Tax=Gloeophyllum trabeum (strain ATCC 11539 / FP-39264 / Madison 617) TaxID=670483 RepID=S7PTG7_GLOTA|nr:uncharacterized protein GLOTRDRAFT_96873 [Gloeophyllum trabeum ATCC 11539]EPQ50602.1 hypothetical protein GLOTRDRAFT_96873 [Gloeophyllum trabeum ATCC 11539]
MSHSSKKQRKNLAANRHNLGHLSDEQNKRRYPAMWLAEIEDTSADWMCDADISTERQGTHDLRLTNSGPDSGMDIRNGFNFPEPSWDHMQALCNILVFTPGNDNGDNGIGAEDTSDASEFLAKGRFASSHYASNNLTPEFF